jgi:hypothetical protein
MPPKQQKEIVSAIQSTEQFLELISPDNKKLIGKQSHITNRLIVIDVHLNWCGPCIVMYQNYRTIWYNYEEADKRLEFYTVSRRPVLTHRIVREHNNAQGLPGQVRCLMQATLHHILCKRQILYFV